MSGMRTMIGNNLEREGGRLSHSHTINSLTTYICTSKTENVQYSRAPERVSQQPPSLDDLRKLYDTCLPVTEYDIVSNKYSRLHRFFPFFLLRLHHPFNS